MKNISVFNSAKKLISSTLLAFFLLSITHNLFHNSHNHAHDSSCSIYVLEEFFTSTDPIHKYKNPIQCKRYTLAYRYKELHSIQTDKHYTIRAPPAYLTFS